MDTDGHAEGPAQLAEGDADGDGLADALERALSEKYAPIVIMDARDESRPTSVPWLLARTDLMKTASKVELASAVPWFTGMESPFSRVARGGSGSPSDWTTYVHAYQRTDGGINLQYWFFYVFNAFLNQHQGDWEQATLQLDQLMSHVTRVALSSHHGGQSE